MKHRHPDTAPSMVTAEHRQHGKRAQQLDQKCPPQDKPRQADDPTDLWRRDRILHGAALHQGDLSSGQQRKRRRYGHNAEAADLDQRQNDRLPKG